MSEKASYPNIIKWSDKEPSAEIEKFLQRPSIDPKAERTAGALLKKIRKDGDPALLEAIEKFDQASLTADRLAVTAEERQDAREQVDADFKRAVRDAHGRISRFAKAGLHEDWQINSPRGGSLGERYVPYDRVGFYIPGGAAPLASTALMSIPFAKVAGVSQCVACTPSKPDGTLDPYLLYAIETAGANEIYRVGGIQAIGAMAYGTETIKHVQKIVGPGGPYVTAAKKLVYGDVALDMVAGPSEIAVLADDSFSADIIAADLLSQAEHGTGHEKILLVTDSRKLAEAVQLQLHEQAETLSRKEAIHRVLQRGALLAVTANLAEGMELVNQFAPEHFELLVREPGRWVRQVRAAGAVFVGPWTPESAGDFAAGPSHVLPTGGAAALFSGLTVQDFRRKISVVSLTQADLKEMLPTIEAFGRIEGLDAHVRSAQLRFRNRS